MSQRETRVPLPPADIATVLFCTAAVFFALAFGGKALEGYRLQRHNAQIEAQVTALQAETSELNSRLQHVQTDAYVQEVAREQYKWTESGETLIVPQYRPQPDASQGGTVVPSSSAVGLSRWLQWVQRLKRLFD